MSALHRDFPAVPDGTDFGIELLLAARLTSSDLQLARLSLHGELLTWEEAREGRYLLLRRNSE